MTPAAAIFFTFGSRAIFFQAEGRRGRFLAHEIDHALAFMTPLLSYILRDYASVPCFLYLSQAMRDAFFSLPGS